MWGHTLTNHNSPCGELWHKVVHKGVAPAFLDGNMWINPLTPLLYCPPKRKSVTLKSNKCIQLRWLLVWFKISFKHKQEKALNLITRFNCFSFLLHLLFLGEGGKVSFSYLIIKKAKFTDIKKVWKLHRFWSNKPRMIFSLLFFF